MKKSLFLLLIVALGSCQEDVKSSGEVVASRLSSSIKAEGTVKLARSYEWSSSYYQASAYGSFTLKGGFIEIKNNVSGETIQYNLEKLEKFEFESSDVGPILDVYFR